MGFVGAALEVALLVNLRLHQRVSHPRIGLAIRLTIGHKLLARVSIG